MVMRATRPDLRDILNASATVVLALAALLLALMILRGARPEPSSVRLYLDTTEESGRYLVRWLDQYDQVRMVWVASEEDADRLRRWIGRVSFR
jgi:hypothetical protein